MPGAPLREPDLAQGEPGPAADAETGYPHRVYAWTVVAILMLTTLLAYTDRQVLSLLVDPIRRELAIDDTRMSLLLGTAFAVVYGIAGVPLGLLADRSSRRNLIFVGVAVWSGGTIACGLAHSFAQLFAARLVVGLGEAVLSPAAISLISDYFPPSRRGTAVGLFLSGIAIGIGASILVGGAVLSSIEGGLLAGTPLATEPAWRLVLLLIGMPGLLWALAILAIREPLRRSGEAGSGAGTISAAAASGLSRGWLHLVPLYVVIATASTVDNAVGAWAPSLLIREFSRDPAQVGVQLGLLLTAGFGSGVFVGGCLADRAGTRGGKLAVSLAAAALIVPVAFVLDARQFMAVLLCVPVYFALSGIVTACGFSAILDSVPNRSRGLAMALAFFFNVALGASVGPTAVAAASQHLFGGDAGLAPALTLSVAAGYAVAVAVLLLALWQRKHAAATASFPTVS